MTALTRRPIVATGSTPRSPRTYASAFAQRDLWSGGDIAAPIRLPGLARVLWLFGDTFVGGLDPDGAPLDGMLRNSFVLQNRGRFEMLSGEENGQLTTPLLADHPDEWLWPSGAVVGPTTVKIVCLRMRAADNYWGWEEEGPVIASLRMADWTVTSIQPAPVPDANLPLSWGGSVTRLGEHVYIPAWCNHPDRWHHVLARTTIETMDTRPWSFWNGETWVDDINTATGPTFDDGGPFGTYWLDRAANGGVVASAQLLDAFTDDITVWRADVPWGPYRRVAQAYRCNCPPGWFSYAGRIWSLPGVGPTAIWSENAWPDTRPFDGAHYGPHFAWVDPGIND